MARPPDDIREPASAECAFCGRKSEPSNRVVVAERSVIRGSQLGICLSCAETVVEILRSEADQTHGWRPAERWR